MFQKFLELSDATKSGSITLAEFIHYVKEHEKSLRLSFSNIDKNKDGKTLLNQNKLLKLLVAIAYRYTDVYVQKDLSKIV